MKEKYFIIRGDRSGVFFGKIKERNSQEAVLTDVRSLWYWDGAASIIQLAAEGTSKPDNCKFTMSVDEVVITDVIEIIPCTDSAVKSIKGVKEWKI